MTIADRRKPPRISGRPPAIVLLAGLFAIFHLTLYSAGPERLPLLIQRLAGLADAGLAMATVLALFAHAGIRPRKWTFLGRKFDTALSAGVCVFALVFAWWLSPLAPIRVQQPEAAATRPSDEAALK